MRKHARLVRGLPLFLLCTMLQGTLIGTFGGAGGSTTTQLAGHGLASFPHFEYVRTFNQTESIEVAVDPYRFPSIRGKRCTLFAVEARTGTQWLQNQALTDARVPGGSQTKDFPNDGGMQSFTAAVDRVNELSSNVGPCYSSVCIGLGHAYDIVLDCDLDGLLSAGDFVDGGTDEAGFYLVHDTVQSKLPVACVNYSFNFSEPPAAPDLHPQRTYAPANFSQLASCGPEGCPTPLPLVVMTHGAGQSYQAYDYLQSHLASYGYVVMSLQNVVAASSVGPEAIAEDILVRTDKFISVLLDADCSAQVFDAASCEGEGVPQGVQQLNLCTLAGMVDTNRIVLIGHSRGGNAIVLAYNRLNPNDPAHLPRFPTQHLQHEDIALLSAMAPLDRPILANPETKPFHLIWVAGDSDISGVPTVSEQELMSFQILERARGHKQSVYIHGGAHGWFHEDCTSGSQTGDCIVKGPGVVTEEQVHDIVKGNYVPLLKVYLEQNIAGQDFLWRPWNRFRPIGAADVGIAKEHRFGTDQNRFVVDDYELNSENVLLSGSGTMVNHNLEDVFEGEMEDQDCHFDWQRSTQSQSDLGDPQCLGLPPFCPPPPCLPGSCPPGCATECDAFHGPPDPGSSTSCDFTLECEFADSQAMNGMTRSRLRSPSRGAVLQWNAAGAFYEWALAVPLPPFFAMADGRPTLTEESYLSFRVAQMPRHRRTTVEPLGDLDFKVVLRDTEGRMSGVCLGAYLAGVIEPYQRAGPGGEAVLPIYDCDCARLDECCSPPGCNMKLSDRGWQAEFETVRIRLGDFLNNGSGLALGNLIAVKFEFGTCGGSTQGRMAVDDVEFTSAGLIHPPPPPCPAVLPCNGVSCQQGNMITSTDTGMQECQPASGPPMHCATGSVHVVTYQCVRAPCCSQQPPCVCQEDCPNGTYLECR